MWEEGRNRCKNTNCLNRFGKMPIKYRKMGANLNQNDRFISMIIAREPMDRLVSCWRDKIWRRSGKPRLFAFDTERGNILTPFFEG